MIGLFRSPPSNTQNIPITPSPFQPFRPSKASQSRQTSRDHHPLLRTFLDKVQRTKSIISPHHKLIHTARKDHFHNSKQAVLIGASQTNASTLIFTNTAATSINGDWGDSIHALAAGDLRIMYQNVNGITTCNNTKAEIQQNIMRGRAHITGMCETNVN